MHTYRCHFYGRTKGAIGIFYWITVDIQAADPEAARLKLYDTHEHIQQLTITDIADIVDPYERMARQ